MDNRLKFLYCIQPELWGHRTITGPGDEIPGASEGGAALEKPRGNPKA